VHRAGIAAWAFAALQHDEKYIGHDLHCKPFLLRRSNLGGNF